MFPLPGFPGLDQTPPEPRPSLLGTHLQLGDVTLSNRVAMAPMTTGFASRAGLPSPRLLAWYEARAAGGVAMVVVEETQVGDDDLCRASIPRRLRLAHDRHIALFRKLAVAIREAGAVPAIQLTYPALPDVGSPRTSEITEIIRAFVAAARRAQQAGFQVVEVQALPSRLLGQLLSPSSNRRRDRYGRGPAGRLRALTEIVAAIRGERRDGLPVIVRYSADERTPRGLTLEAGRQIASALEAAGASALEVVGGASSNAPSELLSTGVGEATRADLAASVRAVVGIPILANGRIVSSDAAERVLREQQADLASMGRALLADPAWVAKERIGLELETIPCISCMACFTPAPDGGTGCPVNGDAGREFLPPLFAAEQPRRITVLGASLAGLELARIAASRGHVVEIVTAGLPLGGLLGLRAGVPGNAEFGRAFLYFGDRLTELGVFISDDPSGEPDIMVDCRPGPEIRPAWARGKGLLLAAELLGRDLHEMYGVGRRVAVAGPGALAAETALFLAGWGRRPTVVVPGSEDAPFPDVHPTHAARLLERLDGYKVLLITGATPLEWVYDEQRRSTLRVRRNGRSEPLEPFHTAVSAAGWPRLSDGPGAELRAPSNRLPSWPQALKMPRLPEQVPVGSTISLGDTPYPEALRDLVAYANLLGRVL
jgi:2,4-dienoyl-CoA reductase-like NADH-dependent reductase (Old Yellow Enzyme family)